jgi:hypothetical protein
VFKLTLTSLSLSQIASDLTTDVCAFVGVVGIYCVLLLDISVMLPLGNGTEFVLCGGFTVSEDTMLGGSKSVLSVNKLVSRKLWTNNMIKSLHT